MTIVQRRELFEDCGLCSETQNRDQTSWRWLQSPANLSPVHFGAAQVRRPL
jgi:hypothetical protein